MINLKDEGFFDEIPEEPDLNILLKQLLNPNPKQRLGGSYFNLKSHAYFK